MDLPLDGAAFTWFRGVESQAMSRIDRTLVFVDWVDHFENVSQRVLPHVISYHCPLLVEAGGVGRGRCTFKFENRAKLRYNTLDTVLQVPLLKLKHLSTYLTVILPFPSLFISFPSFFLSFFFPLFRTKDFPREN